MAEIKLNIPDGVVGRVVDGIAGKYSYVTRKKDGESKGAFGKRMVIEEFVIPAVKDAENGAAYATSKAATDADVDEKVTIT